MIGSAFANKHSSVHSLLELLYRRIKSVKEMIQMNDCPVGAKHFRVAPYGAHKILLSIITTTNVMPYEAIKLSLSLFASRKNAKLKKFIG
jgi:hypothetical protein